MPPVVAAALVGVGVGAITASILAPIIVGIAVSVVSGFVDDALPARPKDDEQ